MKMEVQVVSRATIKPSFPTPNNLKIFNFSFFDQISFPIYVPLVLFYEDNIFQASSSSSSSSCHHQRRRLDLIKKSLAETLTRYYPFAGRFENNKFVDCNDDGVEYVEARVSNCRLSQLMQHPNLNELAKEFLPWDPYPPAAEPMMVKDSSRSIGPISTKVLVAIQVTVFEECGGIVISGLFSHKIADASSLFNFINDWAAATARAAASSSTNDDGDDAHLTINNEEQGPDFKLLHSLFPPKDELRKCFINRRVSGGHNIPKFKGHESLVVKKFVFSASKMADLKKKSTTTTTTVNNNINNDVLPATSRVQVVSALLWKCFIDVDIAKKKKKKEQERADTADAAPDDDIVVTSRAYALTHKINLRAKMVPPLPTNTMGNLVAQTKATVELSANNTKGTSKNDDEMLNYPNLVRKVKESINKFNVCEYVREIQTHTEFPSVAKEVLDIRKFCSDDQFNIVSWCGFKKYERADFGWGKPKWITGTDFPFKNDVKLMDTNSGDGGIEAWVSLSKEDMAEFERHPELIAVTTQSP